MALNIHESEEFRRWYVRPIRSQPQGSKIGLDLSALYWVVSWRGRQSEEDMLSAWLNHCKVYQPEVQDSAETRKRFKEIHKFYSNDLNWTPPILVSIADGKWPHLWQEGMDGTLNSIYDETKDTLVDYIRYVAGVPQLDGGKVIAKWISENSTALSISLERTGSRFADIPSKQLRLVIEALESANCIRGCHRYRQTELA